jgi:hypothetical protein
MLVPITTLASDAPRSQKRIRRPAVKGDGAFKLRTMLDRLPDGIFRYRLGAHRGFEYVNRAMAVRTGIPARQFLADPRRLLRAVHPEDLATAEEMFSRGPTAEATMLRLFAKGGAILWVEIRGTVLQDEDGEPAAFEAMVRWLPSARGTARPPVGVFGDLRIEADRGRVTVGEKAVHLTPSELRVLLFLVERAGEVVSRRAIMQDLWQSSHVGAGAAAETYVSALRRKIERDPRRPSRIETVRGRGYRFVP